MTVLCAIACYYFAIKQHDIDLMALGILIAEIIKVLVMQTSLNKEYDLPFKNITWVELFNTIGFVITYYYHGVYSAMAWYLLVMCILVVTFKKEAKKIIKFIKEIK